MNSTAKKFISASVLSTLLFSAWPLRLGDQHENRGADVAGHEEAEQRRGERKAVLEREDLGGVGGAEQLGHGPNPLFESASLPIWLETAPSGYEPLCVGAHERNRSEMQRSPLGRSTWPIKCIRHDSLASARS